MKISQLEEIVRLKALDYQRNETYDYYSKTTDDLKKAFQWDRTDEGMKYWDNMHEKEYIEPSLMLTFKNEEKEVYKDIKGTPNYYDNSKGSLYMFCENHDVNTYEFDIIKRIIRCRKKGLFLEDLEKTKVLIDLYIKEYKND